LNIDVENFEITDIGKIREKGDKSTKGAKKSKKKVNT
jgi:hypothetical protein